MHTWQAGRLRLSHYTAWGDGYSAGMSQAGWSPGGTLGLRAASQQYAFPALLARQLVQVDSSVAFLQYLAPGQGSGYYAFGDFIPGSCEEQSPSVLLQLRFPEEDWADPPLLLPDNFGLPGLRVSQLDEPVAALSSPFAQRLGLQGSYRDAAAAYGEAFATVWLGLNDVLPYALRGAAAAAHRPTRPAAFARGYARFLRALIGARAEPVRLVVGNLPDVTTFPYFHALPTRYAFAEDCDRRTRLIYFQPDPDLPAVPAQTTDHILLSAEAELGRGLGLSAGNPLPDEMVLDAGEAQSLRDLTRAYNRSIDSIARRLNDSLEYTAVAVADLHQHFEHLHQGTVVDGVELSTRYLEGNVFSTDGRYLSPKGNASAANVFLRAINEVEEWGSSLPLLDLPAYPGVQYP